MLRGTRNSDFDIDEYEASMKRSREDIEWTPCAHLTLALTAQQQKELEVISKSSTKKELNKKRQELMTDVVDAWWTGGTFSPYTPENTFYMLCSSPLHVFSWTTRLKISLKYYDKTKTAFLLYHINQENKGTLVCSILGSISREDLISSNEKAGLDKLHRGQELGAKEFRVQMEISRQKEKIIQDHKDDQIIYAVHAFCLPLRSRCDDTTPVADVEIERRCSQFVADLTWNKIRSRTELYALWERDTLKKTMCYKEHPTLELIPEQCNTLAYIMGGVPAALDPEYRENRDFAELVRLEFYFQKIYKREEGVKYLLDYNEWDFLDTVCGPTEIEEFKRRHLLTKESTNITLCGSMTTEPKMDIDKKPEYSHEIPMYCGWINLADCAVSILESTPSFKKGKVLVFYSDVFAIVRHQMKLDQIESNGVSRHNAKYAKSKNVKNIISQTNRISDTLLQKAKSVNEGNLRNVTIDYGKDSTNQSSIKGKLDMTVGELKYAFPPCIQRMICRAERNGLSLKHAQRKMLAIAIQNLGMPESVYVSIAYPIFAANRQKLNKIDTLVAFKQEWNHSTIWTGETKYDNSSCATLMKNTSSETECVCPFALLSKSPFANNKDPRELCSDKWRKNHPDDSDALSVLYYPSQIVYAKVKSRNRLRRAHVKIEYDSNGSNSDFLNPKDIKKFSADNKFQSVDDDVTPNLNSTLKGIIKEFVKGSAINNQMRNGDGNLTAKDATDTVNQTNLFYPEKIEKKNLQVKEK